jgi:hypothetical protein
MSVSINGSGAITFNDNTTQASAQVGMKNRLIDAGFIINQRGYASGTSLSSGAYAHDRWKAGSSGCTYTFTQGSLGVPITLTITAGSLQQIVEGCNMAEGGTFVLSWTGTAQAKINGGSYSASPLVVTGLTAGANCTVEFGTGTVSQPQLEKGSTATSFDYRPYGTELALCQRYYTVQKTDTTSTSFGLGMSISTTACRVVIPYPVQMRTVPTGAYTGTISVNDGALVGNVSSLSASWNNITNGFIQFTNGAITAAGRAVQIYSGSSDATISFSAEL